MPRWLFLATFALALGAPAAALGQQAAANPLRGPELLAALRAGGYILYYPYFTLVGGQLLSEGEADVVRPRGADLEVVARVALRQWREFAATPVPR